MHVSRITTYLSRASDLRRHRRTVAAGSNGAYRFLMHTDDEKTRAWREALRRRGVSLEPISGNRVWLLLETVLALRHGGVRGFAFRYLNDEHGLLGSLRLAAGELMTVLVCWVAGAEVLWIAHNVDRETSMHHPRLTAFRRWVMAVMAKRILVTDPGLVPHAARQFPGRRHKVSWITFGAPRFRSPGPVEEQIAASARRFAARWKQKSSETAPVLVGSIIGIVGRKYRHWTRLADLLDAGPTCGVRLVAVGIGPFIRHDGATPKGPYYELKSREDVFLWERYARVDEDAFGDHVDFLFRGYSDLSMSYSLYKAAALRIPVLALRGGFVGEAVERYGLGATCEPDFSDLCRALEQLGRYDPANAERFLETHSWDIAAYRFAQMLDVPPREPSHP